jgi:hypothetical protein
MVGMTQFDCLTPSVFLLLTFSKIEASTGVKARCQASPKQVRSHRLVDEEFIDWMNMHVDWDVENMIGYEMFILPVSSKQKE